MKAVARLVWAYFMGSALTRTLTAIGVVLLGLDVFILLAQPKAGEMLWVGVFGLIALFVGSSWMPLMFARLASSHAARVMPGARAKLLASAFVTVLLVSLPVGIIVPAAVVSDTSGLTEVMRDPAALKYVLKLAAITFTSAMIFAGWMYVVLWMLTSKRSLKGLVGTLILVLLLTLLPVREIRDLSVSTTWNLQQLVVVWTVFGAGFLWWPRVRAGRLRVDQPFGFVNRALSGRTTGREFDVLLGTSNPWLGVMALVVPLLLMTYAVGGASTVWLFFLTIFSTVTGAMSGQVPGRSRALWLRGTWSRATLFSAVERSVWWHNAHVLGALTLVFVGIGLVGGFSVPVLAYGVPLLILGSALSTYLGLAATQGLRWMEIVCAIAVMFAPMLLTSFISNMHASLVLIFALESGLFMLAVLLRHIARRRWMKIDWAVCRPERMMVIRGA
jgi:hypothetical protein